MGSKKEKKKEERPSQEPVIVPQSPIEPDREHVLEIEPSNPLKHCPSTVCPFATVAFQTAFPSFEIYGQWIAFLCIFLEKSCNLKQRGKKMKPF